MKIEGKNMKAETLIKCASGFVEQRMAEHGQIDPFWHVVTTQGEQMIVPPMSDDKDEAVALMRVLLKVVDANLCMFVAEAWQIEVTTAETIPVTEQQRLQHPSRKEVVIFQAEDIDGEIMGHRDIIRDAKGKPTLGPLEIERMQVSTGRIIGMLPTRRGERLQ
jgi:hypothetical protein